MKQDLRKFIVPVYLNQKELEMLNLLVEKYGYKKTEVFRLALREFFAKQLSNKERKNLEVSEPQTPEEKCTLMGGKIVDRAGKQYCEVINADKSAKRLYPLESL